MENKAITSIYFGGGTPILFDGIKDLLEWIPRENDCEITVEANPEDASDSTFFKLREWGVNRLSIGVQSLDDRSLQTLERIHCAEKAKQAIHNAHKAGFQNISIDLMYDLPDQSEEGWRYTLDSLDDLPIQHISLYNLVIEPHTSFYKRQIQPCGGIKSLRLLDAALKKFEKSGFTRYEISAFAKVDRQSRHNIGYWTARPFLGFGPSAYSYWNGERFRNIANLHRYARALKEGQSPIDFTETLSYPANVKELLAVQLRLIEGVDIRTFALPESTMQALTKLQGQGLLEHSAHQWRLTTQGTYFYDTVATEII